MRYKISATQEIYTAGSGPPPNYERMEKCLGRLRENLNVCLTAVVWMSCSDRANQNKGNQVILIEAVLIATQM